MPLFLQFWRWGFIPVSSAFPSVVFPQRTVVVVSYCDVSLRYLIIKLMWLCFWDSTQTLSSDDQLNCPSSSLSVRLTAAGRWAGQEKSKVNQSRLPICILMGQRPVFSCVHWLGCEYMAELNTRLWWLVHPLTFPTLYLSAAELFHNNSIWKISNKNTFYI